MNDRDDLTDLQDGRIATTEARLEGFYWVVLGQNPPEIAYWERGEWWLAGDTKPWQPEADRRQRAPGVQATIVGDMSASQPTERTDHESRQVQSKTQPTVGGNPLASSLNACSSAPRQRVSSARA